MPLFDVLKHSSNDMKLLLTKSWTHFLFNRKKVLILANCQGQALYSVLKKNAEFIKRFELIHIEPIHLLKIHDAEEILNLIVTLDVLIYQPIGSNYGAFATDNILKHLKPGANAISFPVAYFTGYNPETIYLKNFDGNKVSIPFDYNDLNIMQMVKEGLSAHEIRNKIQLNDFYEPHFIEKNCELSLTTLADREKNLNIQIAPFIQNNYQSKRLFFSMNHPSNDVLFEIIRQLFDFLNLSGMTKLHLANELLGRTRLYIYPSILTQLNLSIDNHILINNIEYPLEKYIYECYTKYMENSDLVQFNIELNLNKNDTNKQ